MKKTKTLSLLLMVVIVLGTIFVMKIETNATSGIDDFVSRCYSVALQRTPDAGGFAFWKRKLENSQMVGSTIVYNFIFSPEYKDQNKSDIDFVNDLYTMFMGRTADKDGYDFWCGKIAEGWSHEEVFAGFANSDEFSELCSGYGISAGFFSNDYSIEQLNNVNLFVERMYKTTLGRLGDKNGQTFWVEGLLARKYTGITCASNFINSSEYKSLDMSDVMYVENLYKSFMGRESDNSGKLYWLECLSCGKMTRDQVFEGFAESGEFASICDDYKIEAGNYDASDIAPMDGNDNSLTKTEILNDGTVRYDSFDVKGNLTIRTEYYESGKLKTQLLEPNSYGCRECYSYYESGSMSKKTTYDASEKVISSIDFYLLPSDTVQHRYYYGEDNNGNVSIYDEYFNESGINTKSIYYDSEGNIIDVFEFFDNGEVSSRTSYDSTGRITGVIDFYPNSGKRVKHKYFYGLNNDGSFSIYDQYFDEDGKETECIYYDENGKKTKSEQYNAAGRIIDQTEWYKNGQMKYHMWVVNLGPTGGTTIEIENVYEKYYNENGSEMKSYISLYSGLVLETIERYESGGKQYQKAHIRGMHIVEYFYEEDGSVTKEIVSNTDGRVNEKVEHCADESKLRETLYNQNSKIAVIVDTYYDKNVVINKELYFSEPGASSNPGNKYYTEGAKTQEVTYDANGNVTRTAEFFTEGRVKHLEGIDDSGIHYEEFYNENGKRTKRIEYDSQGSVERTVENSFHSNGYPAIEKITDSDENIIEMKEWYENGRMKYFKGIGGDKVPCEEYCDEMGNTLKRIVYDNEGSLVSIVEFFSSGQMKYCKGRGWYDENGIFCFVDTFYNEKGQEIKRIDYDANNNVYSSSEYEYYENGVWSSHIVRDSSGKAKIIWEQYPSGKEKYWASYDEYGCFSEWFYNENRDKVRIVKYDFNGEIDTEKMIEYQYYEDFNVLREVASALNGDVIYIYEYYPSGMKKYHKWYDGGGFPQEEFWDESGCSIKKVVYSSEGNISCVSEYYSSGIKKYFGFINGDGNWVESFYDEEGKKTKSLIKYCDNRIIEDLYDSNGWLITEKLFDINEQLQKRTEYEYDEYGTLIRYIIFDNGDNIIDEGIAY